MRGQVHDRFFRGHRAVDFSAQRALAPLLGRLTKVSSRARTRCLVRAATVAREGSPGSARVTDWSALAPDCRQVDEVPHHRLIVTFLQVSRARRGDRTFHGQLDLGRVLPLSFLAGENPAALRLTGHESFTLSGLDRLAPGGLVEIRAVRPDGTEIRFAAQVRLPSPGEVEYYRHGGILPRVLRAFRG